MPLTSFGNHVTDQAIEGYTSYIKERVEKGLPWERSSEVLSSWGYDPHRYEVHGERYEPNS